MARKLPKGREESAESDTLFKPETVSWQKGESIRPVMDVSLEEQVFCC